jgi:DNA replication initiation complex subunit (GINS family)
MSDHYGRLLEAWRRERHRPDLQPLPEGFFAEMDDYASKLKEMEQALDTASVRGRIAAKEKQYAERMLNELNQTRLRKIATAELDQAPLPTANLTPAERRLHINLRQLLASHRQDSETTPRTQPVSAPTPGEAEPAYIPPPPERRPPAFKVVRFLQPLPAIMGMDMKTYGPFKPEDVASLPVENALNLIRRGIAKEVEIQQ